MSRKDIELPLLTEKSVQSTNKVQPLYPSHFIDYISPDPDPQRYRKIDSLLSYVYFTDALPLVKTVRKKDKDFQHKDLPRPYRTYNIERKIYFLDQNWLAEKDPQKRSIIKTTVLAFKNEIIASVALLMATCTSHLMTTLQLGYIINLITSHNLGESIDFNELFPIAALFSVTYFAAQFFETWLGYYDFIIGAKMRLAITGFIYKKLNCISLTSLHEADVGKVINIVSNDLNDVDFGYGWVFPTLLSPYNILLACIIMWRYFQIYTFISIVCLVSFLVIAIYLSNQGENPRKEKNAITDDRVKRTNELIECIRTIKQYAWEKPLQRTIETLRANEVAALLRIGTIEANGRMVTESSVYLVVLITCIIYVYFEGVLSPEKVYASMMILNFLKFWAILFFHYGEMFFVNLRLIKQRIHDILNLEDVLTVEETQSSTRKRSVGQAGDYSSPVVAFKSDICIDFRNFTGYRVTNSSTSCLRNINLKFQKQTLTAVIGRIGSGKTSLLLALLNELPKKRGEVYVNGSIAYVEQEPIIFPGTIQENILFGREYDHGLYQKVIRACNWNQDFKQLSDEDSTIVGERGITLSGGQKARLSFARALYSNCDVYLLDDPLSAVDSHVGKHIFKYAIKGMLASTTVVLVTHHISYAAESDYVVMLNEGEVQAEGTFNEVKKKCIDAMGIFQSEKVEADNPAAEEENKSQSESRKSSVVSARPSIFNRREGNLVESTNNEQSDSAIVTLQTYKDYLKASENLGLTWIILMIYLISQIFIFAFTRYLGYWATLQTEAQSRGESFDNTSYAIVSSLLCSGIALTYNLKISLTIKFLTHTNTKLHNRILLQLLRAKVSFFDSVSSGKILNRFSGDVGILDKQNWENVFELLDGVMYVGFFLGYLCLVNLGMLAPSILVIYILYKIKVYFTVPSIQLKRVDLESRSPIYTEVTSTLNGLLIIRVYKQGGRFITNFIDLLYKNSQAFLYNSRMTRIFMISLKIFLYLLTILGLLLFIVFAYYGNVESGVFGLSLLYLLEIANKSVSTIRQTLYLDVNMQSAQRILDYLNLPQEPASRKELMDSQVQRASDGKWPNRGEIEFRNVFLRYKPDLNPALKGISFHIEPTTKVGIVGRTGAGKSSITQALFRMVEIDDVRDSYIKIDAVNIQEIGLEFLRKNIAIIPQTPMIFSGTVKQNLDPFDTFSTEEIWTVLEKIGVKPTIQSLSRGLETEISNTESQLSSGQKQLLCLARAMLRRSKIIVLDEATANVDLKTDELIQNVLKSYFVDCTILTIAHRLNNIADYDKVLAIDNGSVVEFGSPYSLLVMKEGDKDITNLEGYFARMVVNAGESTAKEVFDKAYEHYSNL